MTDPRVIDVRRADARDVALAHAAEGELVVLAASGDDALTRAGAIARAITVDGGRAAVFAVTTDDDCDHDAIAEMLAELDVRE
ncbi:MAG TPA: hypothetical protein VFC33_11810 [Acidimicrobiia bacterium]|nr:hypothetical protein [Acidimicrobiia bacterium]